MKRRNAAIIVALLTAISPMSGFVRASQEITRECRDVEGHLLYIVRGEEVRTPSNLLLGTVKNGDVRDSGNRLLAHGGDAGLLYCLTRK